MNDNTVVLKLINFKNGKLKILKIFKSNGYKKNSHSRGNLFKSTP